MRLKRYIIPMNEQFDLDFSPKTKEDKGADPEILSDEELAGLYKLKIGIDAKFRALSREEMLTGIADPTAELERIAEIDRREDRKDLSAPYRGR